MLTNKITILDKDSKISVGGQDACLEDFLSHCGSQIVWCIFFVFLQKVHTLVNAFGNISK